MRLGIGAGRSFTSSPKAPGALCPSLLPDAPASSAATTAPPDRIARTDEAKVPGTSLASEPSEPRAGTCQVRDLIQVPVCQAHAGQGRAFLLSIRAERHRPRLRTVLTDCYGEIQLSRYGRATLPQSHTVGSFTEVPRVCHGYVTGARPPSDLQPTSISELPSQQPRHRKAR